MRDAVIIICTRLESKRLPGKALLPIEGLQALEHIILRIQDSGIPIWLAVPFGESKNFSHLCDRYPEVGLYEGNPGSPLHRIADFIKKYPTKHIIRITHDDLLIDSSTMLALLQEVEDQDAGYGYSPSIVEGAGVEVICSENLLKAAEREESTEFISYFVKEGPNKKQVKLEPRASIKRPYRLTMDYPEDALVLKIILRELGPLASLDSICHYLDGRAYILGINRQPDISFYIAAKDMEDYVGDAILSILNTGIPNCELIVIDDGSKDRTLSEIAKFSNDPRISIVINDHNLGLASSSNVAIAESRGKIIMRVDADDMLIAGSFFQHWLEIKQMIESGHQIVYPAYTQINQYGGVEQEVCDPNINHHAGCAIMNKSWLNEWRYKSGLQHWDGLELFQRVKQSANPGYIQTPLWQYRKHENSMSSSNPEERKKALEKLERSFS